MLALAVDLYRAAAIRLADDVVMARHVRRLAGSLRQARQQLGEQTGVRRMRRNCRMITCRVQSVHRRCSIARSILRRLRRCIAGCGNASSPRRSMPERDWRLRIDDITDAIQNREVYEEDVVRRVQSG